MGFLFRAYDPRPNYYHGHFQPGGTPHPNQHYLHQPQYPQHGQHHGYDYQNQPNHTDQYPYPYQYDHGNYGQQQPYWNDQQYQQYNHYQQVPIPYQPFIYDTRDVSSTHSIDTHQPE